MSSKSKKPNKIKLIKRISREAFMGADVRSKAYKDASKYSRKHKHKKDWSEQK
jgi:protein-L-isoaspartate O-methyltransferase